MFSSTVRWNRDTSCGTTAIIDGQALARGKGDVLAVDDHLAFLRRGMTLQQGQQGGLAGAGTADHTNLLPGRDLQLHVAQDRRAAGRGGGIAEGDVLENDLAAMGGQGGGVLGIRQVVRHQQGGQCFPHPGHVLRQVHQRHGQVAGGMQDGEPQRADQHDVAGGGAADLPEMHGPAQEAGSQHRGRGAMHQPQLLQVAQAGAAGAGFGIQGMVQARTLTPEGAEGTDKGEVLHHVHQLPVHGGGPAGKGVMQLLALAAQGGDAGGQGAGGQHQATGHDGVHAGQEADSQHHGHGRWHGVPGEVLQQGEGGGAGGADAAGQRAGGAIGEVARRMACQMAEQLGPHGGGGAGEAVGRNPAADAPQHVIGGDHAGQDGKGHPHRVGADLGRIARERVDQVLHRVVRADRAGHRTQHRCHDRDMRSGIGPQVPEQEGHGAMRVAQHLRRILSAGFPSR
jgi:hypothetical protein